MDNMKVVVLDDEEPILVLADIMLYTQGYESTSMQSAKDFISHLDTIISKHDMLFLDMVMPEMDGNEVLEKIRSKYPDYPVVIFSSMPSFVKDPPTWVLHKMELKTKIGTILSEVKEYINSRKV